MRPSTVFWPVDQAVEVDADSEVVVRRRRVLSSTEYVVICPVSGNLSMCQPARRHRRCSCGRS